MIPKVFGKPLAELDGEWRLALQVRRGFGFLRYTTLEARTVPCAGGPMWSEGAHDGLTW
jgi:hypothetical protein